ncbi:unnamed protein product [Psylliodes chrysocephalus]|uniref:CLIP domain-containing serine protease n=1 Tax=Psylliodes chrysocephalus TaxID=3402493 RepID=A0A9P0GDN7_9CUCU|nr:unnamed protein product [Psylliodes chrysocephala]
MRLTTKWLGLCFVLLVINVQDIISNFTTRGYGQPFDGYDSDVTTEASVSSEESFKTTNLTVELKFAIECETPNHDSGICIEIKQCPILYKQLPNVNARKFLQVSQCGLNIEDGNMPKVCCGKFDNYIHSENNISRVEDYNIFPKKCGPKKVTLLRSRILGGTKAAIGEFPWMARLIHNNNHNYKSVGCSAFLIHTKYVLTAAHCVHKAHTTIRGPVFSVILGEHNTETKVDCNPLGTYCADPLQISRVGKVIVHPGYNVDSPGHYNDIAIIHMKKAARISEFVQPICLQTDPTPINSGIYLISGWGKTEDEMFSKIKMKLEVPAVEFKDCSRKYNEVGIELQDTQICAGGEEGKDSCTGDSGGPLIMENGTNYLAVGVVSYGLGCGNKGWPGVYTNIPTFIPWIKQQIIANSLVSSKSPKQKKHHNKKKGGVKSSNK